jgi:hypothetical protein
MSRMTSLIVRSLAIFVVLAGVAGCASGPGPVYQVASHNSPGR